MKAILQPVEIVADSVQLLVGVEAFAKLSDAGFLAEWDALYFSCPWATVFQSRQFVATWYHIYREIYNPVIILHQENGKLLGLLPLTLLKDKLVGAGHFDAKYQTWLSLPSNQEEFVKNALSTIRKRFPGLVLELKYVPNKTPLDGLKNDRFWKNRCVIGVRNSPLMATNVDAILKELSRSTMKKKQNRLKKLGNLSFERILDKETFSDVYDQIIVQNDFRRAAKFNAYRQIPYKKELLMALFEQNLLHATVLKLNNHIMASVIAVEDHNRIYSAGINSYDPLYSKYSPGILHFLMLGLHANKEEITTIDLTPGDDPYKDALSSGQEQVYELMIAHNGWSYLKSKIRTTLYLQLMRKGINPNLLKQFLLKKFYLFKERLKRGGMQWLDMKSTYRLKDLSEATGYLVYKNKSNPFFTNSILRVNKNKLEDMLKFVPNHTNMTKWEFMEDAMHRFESGQQSYTYVENGNLCGCIWFIKNQLPRQLPQINHALSVPDGASILHNLYWPLHDTNKLIAFITSVVKDILLSEGIDKEVFVPITTKEKDILPVLKAVGFEELKKESDVN